MKNILNILTLSALSITCNDQIEIAQTSTLHENVGAQVSIEAAMRWTERESLKPPSQFSRIQIEEPLPSSYLYNYLEDIESKLGIAFHYGLDANNEIHLLVIKYDYTEHWCENVFDTKTKVTISKVDAHNLCDRYKSINSHGPWSHFLGKNLVVDILNKPTFSSFQLIPAINDEYEPQLLLYVWLSESTSSGRPLQSELEVYDKGYPCPASCPNEN